MGPSDALAPRLFATRGHLAIGLALMALLVAGGGLWPLGPDAPVGRWFAVAGLLAVLAALTPVLPQRPWTMPATLAAGMLGAGVLLASCVTAEGLVVLSLGVITAAQLAAYAFPARDAGLLLGLALGVITFGMVAAPLPFHAMTWAVVTIMAVASTSLLGYVTNRLRQHATTDDLTGALTRGALLQRLVTHLHEAQRTGAPLAVVSADVDDFKTVNDTRGHLAGDEVLASLVATWRESLGPRASIGRVGGDEFVVVLPGRDRAAAERWVAAARAGYAQPWSAGIAVAGRTDTTRDLLDRADVALYAAKAARSPARPGHRGADVTR